MNDNLKYWEQLRQPPVNVLRTIGAGRLKGMTDIKPMWRIQIMTEVFGPCGIGWKYVVTNKGTEQGSDGQVFAFVDVDVFIKVDSEWSEPIHGSGGSMLIAKERSGLHSSDEAFKMATTDALSSALKMIGVAADIHMGWFDGSKYNVPEPKKTFIESVKELNPTPEELTKALERYGFKAIEEITEKQDQIVFFKALKAAA